ncbi:MAG TPA: hypothetical protein VM165_20670, partial [Planctomycetaceae bacterium]|nr:hypothetical protein [Planctomycetaceae bacterium]
MARSPTIAEEQAWSERLRTLVSRRAADERLVQSERDAAIAEERREFEAVSTGVTEAFDAEQHELTERFQSAIAAATAKWTAALAA